MPYCSWYNKLYNDDDDDDDDDEIMESQLLISDWVVTLIGLMHLSAHQTGKMPTMQKKNQDGHTHAPACLVTCTVSMVQLIRVLIQQANKTGMQLHTCQTIWCWVRWRFETEQVSHNVTATGAMTLSVYRGRSEIKLLPVSLYGRPDRKSVV